MGCRRAAPLGPSTFRSACIEREPVRPVSAQLEEVVEVDEAAVLQIAYQSRQHVLRGQRTESDQSVFNAKFLIGKIVSLVDDLSSQTVPGA